MKEVKVEKGVPLPPPQCGPGAVTWSTTAAAQMEFGDSVELPTVNTGYALCKRLKYIGKGATMRKLPTGKYRVWCVEPRRKK